MNKLSWLLAGIVIATAAFVLIVASPGAKAWQSGDAYSGSGDWTINNPTIVGDEAGITVNGNLIINNRLEVYASTISINSGSDNQYRVNVTSSGSLVLYGSTLTASNGAYHYSFLVWGSLDINQSSVSEMWGDTASWAGGIQIYKSGAQVRNSNIFNGRTGGIYIYNASATVKGCSIYNNGPGGSSTTYCFGIFMANDGLGATTSTQIDSNLIYNNYYALGTTRYGYGIRSEFQSAADTITNNQIYDNGFSTSGTNNGYQLYLQYSNATVTDNQLRNGSYQIYVYGSGPIAFKNLNISSFARMSSTSYGVYAYNSTLSFSKCDWYAFSCAYTMYGVWANGPSINSSSNLTFNNCTFNYSQSGTYSRFLIYGNSYTGINVTDCTAVNVFGSFTGLYSANYGFLNVINTKIWTNQTTSTTFMRGSTRTPVFVAGCYLNLTTATSTVYGIYASSYSNITFNDSTIEFTDARTTTYFIYANSYCPIISNNVKLYGWYIGMNGSGNLYGIYCQYGKVVLSNMTFMLRDCTPSYTYMAYAYNYNVQGGGLWINNSNFDDQNCRAYYYHYLIYNYYGIGYYSNFTANVNRTYNSYYYYGNYVFFDYGTSGNTLTMLNCTINDVSPGFVYGVYCYYKTPYIDNSTIYMCATYYLYGFMTGYTDTVTIQNSKIIGDYNSNYQYFYFIYCYNYNARTQFTITGSTIQFNTYQSGSAYYGLFYIYYIDLYLINSTIKVENRNNVMFAVPIFYYMYDAGVWINDTTLNLTYGTDSGVEAASINVGTFQQTRNVNLTNSTIRVTTRNNPLKINCFYLSYGLPVLSLVNSRVEFIVDSPNSVINMVAFDTANAGALGLLYLKQSTLSLTVKRAGSAATMLALSEASAINKFVLLESTILVDLQVNTGSPISGVQLSGVKELTLKDLVLRLSAPVGDSEVVGISMQKSSPVLDNITITGNGQGRIRGILCDLASSPTITNSRITGAYSGVKSVFFSRPIISNIDVSGCTEGITVDSNGNGTLRGGTINGTAVGARLLDASWLSIIDTNFTNNTQDLRLDAASTAWFLNSGFTRAKIQFDDDKSAIIVNWYLQLKVLWKNKDGIDSKKPIPGAEVVMTYSSGAEFLRTVATQDGIVPWLTAPEYTETRLAKTSYSPYKVSLAYKGFPGTDSLTVSSTKEHPVYITDDAVPVVEITEPADGAIQNIRDVVLRGVSTDLGSGLDTLRFSYDGVNWDEVPAAAMWEHLLVPPEGAYTITVKVRDIAGNEQTAAIGVTIDLTAPFIEISSPADNSLGNSIGVQLTGRVEPGSELTVNHRPVAVDKDGNFVYGLRLVEGKNLFTLFARDRAGNTNSTLWTLNLDITPPPLLLGAPVDGLLTNQRSVTVSGRTEPGASVKLNDAAIEVGPDGSFSVVYDLKLGANPITVVASDIAGNTAQQMRTVVLDNEIRLSVEYPVDNSATNQLTILARGTTDTDVLLRLNDGIVTVAQDGTFSVTFTLNEGQNELIFAATDRAGNAMSVTRHMLLDTVRPTLEILSPQPGALLRSRDVTVTGSCEPGISLKINGENVTTETGLFSKTLQLPEGQSIINIEGSDAAGNLVSMQITVLVDLTPPSLEIVEPSTGFRTRDYSVIVVGLTEPGALVTVNGLPVVVDPFGKFTTTVTLQKGKNAIKVVAADSSGNNVDKAITVTGTTEPAKAAENNWWWAAAGLIMALGIMLPLTALLVNVAVKGRKGQEGSK